jgi:hypothetical protein
MQITNPDCARKPRNPSASVGMPTERDRRNRRYELSPEDQEKVDVALAAVARIKASFDDWIIVGHFVVAARKHADLIGGRQAFQHILAEQRIMPPLGKAEISRLEKVMARLGEVTRWREGLAENQQIAWAAPRSILNHCPVFQIEKERQRAATPRKPTRLESALEENVSLKAEVERYRRAGDDCGFSRQDRAADIAGVLTRGLSEHKQRAVMLELVHKLGTAKQRAAFNLDDDQPAPPIPAAGAAA